MPMGANFERRLTLNRAGPLDDAISSAVEHVLYANLRALGGSFSAEHGVGAKRISGTSFGQPG